MPHRLLTLGSIALISIAWLFFHGIDLDPTKRPPSVFCRNDLGTSMNRGGHQEEMLWRGCLIASESTTYFKRYTTALPFRPEETRSCLACHGENKTAPSFAEMWVSFPKVDPVTGKLVDFARAIRKEAHIRYGAALPGLEDSAITSLYLYAATKAGQQHLTYRMTSNVPASPEEIKALKKTASPDCTAKFDEKSWPSGQRAKFIVKGCNLVTDTSQYATSLPVKPWQSSLTCQSCHRDAGDRENAGSLAHAAVLLPHMLSSLNRAIRHDDRILMCFARSLNWLDLGLNAPEIQEIIAYSNWLAQVNKLPMGVLAEGRGMPALQDTSGLGASFMAGEQAYNQRCFACHGPNGWGISGSKVPPLTGKASFNMAATLAHRERLTGFIYYNMPPMPKGTPPILTRQEALDIAAYLSSFSRPEDPVHTSVITQAAQRAQINLMQYLGTVGEGSDVK